MELTAAQQKYFAYWLTRSLPSDSLGKLTTSLQDAQVDLTPQQIDAVLSAFKIKRNSKDKPLFEDPNQGFARLEELGIPKKTLIFA